MPSVPPKPTPLYRIMHVQNLPAVIAAGCVSCENKRHMAGSEYLFARRAELEKAFGAPLEWRRLDDNKVSMVVASQEFDGYNREQWPAMTTWLTENVRKFEQTFAPHIPALRQLLMTQFPKGASNDALSPELG